MRKRIITSVICFSMGIALCACGNKQVTKEESAVVVSSESNISDEAEESGEETVTEISEEKTIWDVGPELITDHSDLPVDAFDINYYEVPNGITVFQLYMEMNSADLTDELLEKIYFDYYYPLYSVRGDDDVRTYIIFNDVKEIPSDYGKYLGCYMSFNGSVESYLYIDTDERGLFTQSSSQFCTSDNVYYKADEENKTLNREYTADDFTDEETDEYIRNLPGVGTTEEAVTSVEKDGIEVKYVSSEVYSSHTSFTFKITNNTDSTLTLDTERRHYVNKISLEQYGTIKFDTEVAAGKATIYDITLASDALTCAGSVIDTMGLNLIINGNAVTYQFSGLGIRPETDSSYDISAEKNSVKVTLVETESYDTHVNLIFKVENKGDSELTLGSDRRHYINGLSIEQYGSIKFADTIPSGCGTVYDLTLKAEDLKAAGTTIDTIDLELIINGEAQEFTFDSLNIGY